MQMCATSCPQKAKRFHRIWNTIYERNGGARKDSEERCRVEGKSLALGNKKCFSGIKGTFRTMVTG